MPAFRALRAHGGITTCCLALALASATPARAGHPVVPQDPVEPQIVSPWDPLMPLLQRIDAYFQAFEVDGVVLDSRWVISATEAARLSVIPQLLGYAELHRALPTPRLREDIVQRADYLSNRFQEFRSGTVFDGMLAYAMLEAFTATGDSAYLERGDEVLAELRGIPDREYILNGGLMAAMAFAKHHRLTGDAESERRVRLALSTLPAYQHPDGSFPHWCAGSRDVHYTAWMANELIWIQRQLDDPAITPTLERMRDFLEQRVSVRGVTSYQAPCPGHSGCTDYYYSIATGCGQDYDTRGFINELGYHALLFDRFRSPRYRPLMEFMDSLEDGGTVPDKWDYPVPPTDPYYPWANADTSVLNTSLMLWSLGSVVTGRMGTPVASARELPAAVRAVVQGAEAPARPRVAPNPARGICSIHFALPRAGEVALEVLDVAGRRVRRVLGGRLEAGEHRVRWDRDDDAGRPCPSGLYFVRLHDGPRSASAPVLVIR